MKRNMERDCNWQEPKTNNISWINAFAGSRYSRHDLNAENLAWKENKTKSSSR